MTTPLSRRNPHRPRPRQIRRRAVPWSAIATEIIRDQAKLVANGKESSDKSGIKNIKFDATSLFSPDSL